MAQNYLFIVVLLIYGQPIFAYKLIFYKSKYFIELSEKCNKLLLWNLPPVDFFKEFLLRLWSLERLITKCLYFAKENTHL